MMVSFNQLFATQNGMISPRVPVNINGVVMSPGVTFGGGVAFGGVSATQLVGKTFEVEVVNGIYVLKSAY